ncbi:tyrosine-type recombinase/integrase [Hoeflea poritis]|uniref:Site-specific integrase n=1 Tax=Hoeflea poritis TaxID=2993659 RepID=A0ABT4VJ78_9HYPH|nr:site-specific integrase [Hoeflea poritis]MDA4844753.1 site-specific integrase [Hoeflea poritis]
MLQNTTASMNSRMRIYDERNQRLYINAPERQRFLVAANKARLPVRAFCLTLLYTGCRLSEALELTTTSIDPASDLLSFRTLKKRNRHHIREVPIPPELSVVLASLKELRVPMKERENFYPIPLWTYKQGQPLNRITGYRWVKRVMDKADIHGAQASPKGLRHGYGVHALRMGIPLNMLSKWMGHASIATTAIYGNAVGSEELEIAGRMWG